MRFSRAVVFPVGRVPGMCASRRTLSMRCVGQWSLWDVRLCEFSDFRPPVANVGPAPADLAQLWPKPDRSWVGPNAVEAAPKRTTPGGRLDRARPTSARRLARSGPTLVVLRWLDISFETSGRIRPSLGRIRPSLADRIWADFVRTKSAQRRPNPTDFGDTSAKVGPICRPNLGDTGRRNDGRPRRAS